MGDHTAIPPAAEGVLPRSPDGPAQPPVGRHSTDPPPCADLLLEEESCVDAQDGELDGLWTTISIFITLFLLSVCYSATVTLFKVGVHPAGPSGPLSVPRVPAESLPAPHCPLTVYSYPWGRPTWDPVLAHPVPPQVKWIFSSAVELKRTMVPDYRNTIGQGA